MNWDVEGTIREILLQNVPNILNINRITLESDRTFGGYTCKIGSVSVDLLLKTSEDEIKSENLKLIMKYLPEETNDTTLKLSFQKELLMYKIAIPEYIGLQKELNIEETLDFNIFPKYFGSNIKENGCSTGIAVFLMNDLGSSGYVSAEHMNELNLDHAKIVIDNLALYHAIGIKLKETRPEIFKGYFYQLVKPALRNANNPNKYKIDSEFIENVTTILNSNANLKRFTNKVINLIMKINDNPLPVVREPFATLLHNDMWKNNLLFKYSDPKLKQSKPLCVKFIDFQFVIYNSPIRDLVHLIYTSCSSEIQKDFCSISLYFFEKIVDHLTLLKCENISIFNFDTFQEEIHIFAWTKLKHIISTILLTNDEAMIRDDKLLNLFVCFESNGWL